MGEIIVRFPSRKIKKKYCKTCHDSLARYFMPRSYSVSILRLNISITYYQTVYWCPRCLHHMKEQETQEF